MRPLPPAATDSSGSDIQGILRRLVAGVGKDIDALPDRMEDKVHDIRVRMKKFRAVLRLAEGSIKKAEFAKSDKIARSLKDHFGSARDNDVLRELLLDLLEKPEAFATSEALGFEENRRAGPDSSGSTARELCSQLAALVDRFTLPGLDKKALREVWVGTYRNSRRAMRVCRKNRSDDFLFHEWRKRVKEILYQSAAIGSPLDSFVPKADKLSSVLGSHHDLAILTDRMASHAEITKAERVARAKKREVARRALVIGRKLFLEKPSVWQRRLQKI